MLKTIAGLGDARVTPQPVPPDEYDVFVDSSEEVADRQYYRLTLKIINNTTYNGKEILHYLSYKETALSMLKDCLKGLGIPMNGDQWDDDNLKRQPKGRVVVSVAELKDSTGNPTGRLINRVDRWIWEGRNKE